MRKTIVLMALSLLVLSTGAANAQTWSKEQTEVWKVVLKSYEDIDAKDANWSDKWVFADAVVWSHTLPMPRNRDSIKRWDRYQFARGTNHLSEYTPAGIVVHDSTAVVHYYYANATEDKDGKHETTRGRCSDVLAKDGKSWKFISWSCGDEPSD